MWNPYGMDVVHVESIWNGWSPCAIHVESIWNPSSFHVESMWTFHHSMWNLAIPSSFHVEFGHSIIIPCGIQVEWRPQNEWNHSQNIFHGVHMESMWNDVDSM